MRTIELYKFVMDTQIWTLTSGDTSIVYNSETYVPAEGLDRGSTEVRNELSRAALDVKLDVQHALSQVLLTGFTEQVLTLTLYSQDQETATTTIEWKGRLSSQKPIKHLLSLSFESVFTSMRRPGLRARYQKVCRHVLYGRGCLLDPDNFATAGVCSAVTATAVTVPEAAAQADGYYVGGMLRHDSSGLYGFIISHVGSTLLLQRPLDSLITARAAAGWGRAWGRSWGGTAVTIYPGCDKLRQTCLNKFSNLLNFGGFPWIPSRNPMDGSSIV